MTVRVLLTNEKPFYSGLSYIETEIIKSTSTALVEITKLIPNGGKTQLLIHTNTNYLLDLYILLGIFDRGY
jgi:hypothetical protein